MSTCATPSPCSARATGGASWAVLNAPRPPAELARPLHAASTSAVSPLPAAPALAKAQAASGLPVGRSLFGRPSREEVDSYFAHAIGQAVLAPRPIS
ncbi:hypothetical protein HYH03_016852 [Edaphochlamys debaryana]|uniref:Uncharacterized protein n=1 Tax=Edaphochlamys debaryana TaxID=47281 RepID=A0A835XQJ3_9CHLO|nr:hypothetical protein HYH03_016852 [Edaphochlamys debaryana]|eukprot:KAG2484309.1 hypothetical protein HYH03_016852 [Edaphochlamys debaryana]